MNDVMKIVKILEESGLLIKDLSKAIINGVKEQRSRFLSMLLGILCASSIGNLLTGKEMKARIPASKVIRLGEGTFRAGQYFQWFLTLQLILKYYQNEPNVKGVYSRNSLPKRKDRAYVMNLHEYYLIRTNWITFCVNDDNVTYLNSFRVKDIQK